MPEAMVGLDIGRHAVKALLAVCRGRSDIQVLAFETALRPEEADLSAAIKKLADTIRPLAPARLNCVVSLPASEAMFRFVRLPFRDEGKIKKTLYFELEPLLPMPVEEVVADYTLVPPGGLLAAAVEKAHIRKVIETVETHLADVSIVDIAPAALALPLLERKALSGAGMVLDVGARESGVAFYQDNALVSLRSFAFGGETITQALADDGSCGRDEAERLKLAATYGEKVDKTIAVCRDFCASLSNTVEFLRLNEILSNGPVRLLVTGGGSLFEPLRTALSSTFGTPAESLFAVGPSGHLHIDEPLAGRYVPDTASTALALLKRAQATRKSFNFRQGDLAAKSLRDDLRRHLRLGAAMASIIVVLAAADFGLGYYMQARQAALLKSEISRIFKKHFSGAAVMVDPVRQLTAKLAEDKKNYGLADGVASATVLEQLKEISQAIPPELEVVVTHLHCENKTVLLAGEAQNVEDVTRVKNELAKLKRFKMVDIGKTSLAGGGAKVNFDVRMELK